MESTITNSKEYKKMEVTFYGTRGGQAAPSNEKRKFYTARYGGNTTHLLVKHGEEYVFLDGGTGISVASDELIELGIGKKESPLKAKLLLTHFHPDHVEGLPFFGLLGPEWNEFDVYGRDTAEHVEKTLRDKQIDERIFPVAYIQDSNDNTRASFKSVRRHHNVYEISNNGAISITATATTHPGGCVAYRFTTPEGQTFVFGGDHEFGLGERIDENLHYFCKNVHTVVLDTQFTPEEYSSHKNWGHSSYDRVIDFGLKAGVKRLVMTHHDKRRDDQGCDSFYEGAISYLRQKQGQSGLELIMAQEGMKLEI